MRACPGSFQRLLRFEDFRHSEPNFHNLAVIHANQARMPVQDTFPARLISLAAVPHTFLYLITLAVRLVTTRLVI